MVKLKYYIKNGDDFISVEDFSGKVPDPNYVDSAMELTVDGVPVITCAEWDYMRDLTSYIGNGFEDLAETNSNEWTTYFPDQPIKLTIRLNKIKNQIHLEVDIPKSDALNLPQEKRTAAANLDKFLTEMSSAGQKFFLRMAEIVPEDADLYKDDADRMRETAEKLRKSVKLGAKAD